MREKDKINTEKVAQTPLFEYKNTALRRNRGAWVFCVF
jgi:hypothetical protein